GGPLGFPGGGEYGDGQLAIDRLGTERALQVVYARDRRSADFDDDIATLDSGDGCRRSCFDRLDAHTCLAREIEVTNVAAWQRHGFPPNAEPRAPHATVAYQRDGDPLRGRRSDRETDALRRQDDRGVDADHLAARVDERTSRIAGIERGIGLQHVVEQASRLRSHRAAERADNARRHRVLESVGIADSNRDLL